MQRPGAVQTIAIIPILAKPLTTAVECTSDGSWRFRRHSQEAPNLQETPNLSWEHAVSLVRVLSRCGLERALEAPVYQHVSVARIAEGPAGSRDTSVVTPTAVTSTSRSSPI